MRLIDLVLALLVVFLLAKSCGTHDGMEEVKSASEVKFDQVWSRDFEGDPCWEEVDRLLQVASLMDHWNFRIARDGLKIMIDGRERLENSALKRFRNYWFGARPSYEETIPLEHRSRNVIRSHIRVVTYDLCKKNRPERALVRRLVLDGALRRYYQFSYPMSHRRSASPDYSGLLKTYEASASRELCDLENRMNEQLDDLCRSLGSSAPGGCRQKRAAVVGCE